MRNKSETATKLLIGLLAGIHLLWNQWPNPEEAFYALDKFTFLGNAAINGEPWRLVTGAFLHADLIHLLCNGYCLWQFLPWITDSFGFPKAQLTLWLAVVGGASLSGYMDPYQPGVGISGGIFGLFGVYIVALRVLKKHHDNSQINAALNSAYLMLGANLFLGFQVESISNAGHIGGLIVGLILGLIFTRPRIQRADI